MIDLDDIESVYLGERYEAMDDPQVFVDEVTEILDNYDRRALGRAELTPELSTWMLESFSVDPYAMPDIFEPHVLGTETADAIYLDRYDRVYVFGASPLEPFSDSEFFAEI